MAVRKTLIGLVTVFVLGLVAWGAWVPWRRPTAGAEVVASIGTIAKTVVATGRVVPRTEVTLANKMPGRIKAVLVKEGDLVTSGQPVILFEDRELLADVHATDARIVSARADARKAEHALEAARANWREIKSGSRPQEVARARAEVEQARQRWETAEAERRRASRLLADGYISRSQYDSSATEADVTRARLRAAEETLSLVTAGPKSETVAAAWARVREAESEVRQAESRVPQAIAEGERAHAMLENATVAASIDAKVTKKLVEPGEAVDTGKPLVILGDVSKTIVKAEVDETDVGTLDLGQPAQVTTDAFPGRVFPATVYEIGQAVGKRKIRPEDPVKIQDMKVLETKLEVTDGGDALKLGMTVDVKIIVARRDQVLVLPRTVVTIGKSDAVVSVIGPGGTERRRITLGSWDDGRVEVTGGLRAGERVLVRPGSSP
jgi:HlyD family secretion protein